jgi:uncharacterized protein YuzE
MEVKYDPKIDALYITLSSGQYEKTKKISDSVLVDETKEGKIIGIEILDATENIRHFNAKQLSISLQLSNLSSRQI